MIGGAMVAGLAGAVISGGGALAVGHSALTALGCYMAGGSATMLLALVAGARNRTTEEDSRA